MPRGELAVISGLAAAIIVGSWRPRAPADPDIKIICAGGYRIPGVSAYCV